MKYVLVGVGRDKTENMDPTHVATAKKLLLVRTSCASWGLRG